jgi:hypothetical protein
MINTDIINNSNDLPPGGLSVRKRLPVHRDLSPPEAEAVRRFKLHLAAAKRIKKFIFGREVAYLANTLTALLQNLKEEVKKPGIGVELVAGFFRSDEKFYEHCDDSNGTLGEVFRIEAHDLFVHYAKQCNEKEWLADIVCELQEKNDYGLRDGLIDAAAEFLPEPVIRSMIERFWNLTNQETVDHQKQGWLLNISSLARQLHDAPLFEKASFAAWPEGSIAQCIDIAQVYLEYGDASTALSWLERVPPEAIFGEDKRDEFLLKVYKQLGNRSKAAEIAWRFFRRWRHENTLELLLETIGPQDYTGLINNEVRLILDTPKLSFSDTRFLIHCGRNNEAEDYLLNRVDQLDGNYYPELLSLADTMEKDERYLVTTLIYRALLESILERAISKYYTHGVRYLCELETLAPYVIEWRQFIPHDLYFDQVRKENARKSSFWARYEARKDKSFRE